MEVHIYKDTGYYHKCIYVYFQSKKVSSLYGEYISAIMDGEDQPPVDSKYDYFFHLCRECNDYERFDGYAWHIGDDYSEPIDVIAYDLEQLICSFPPYWKVYIGGKLVDDYRDSERKKAIFDFIGENLIERWQEDLQKKKKEFKDEIEKVKASQKVVLKFLKRLMIYLDGVNDKRLAKAVGGSLPPEKWDKSLADTMRIIEKIGSYSIKYEEHINRLEKITDDIMKADVDFKSFEGFGRRQLWYDLSLYESFLFLNSYS